jgi:hypothetical protein
VRQQRIGSPRRPSRHLIVRVTRVPSSFLPAPGQPGSMTDFDGLDLQSVEDELDEETEGEGTNRIVLGVLDGTTPPEEWVETIDSGAALVLNVEGDLNELAAGFARDVKETGGELMHFRDFLVVTPPGVTIDANRLA